MEKISGWRRPGGGFRLALAVLIPLLTCALQFLIWPTLQPYAWLLFYPAVFLSAWIGGQRGGLVATALSTGLVWYFFIPSRLFMAGENPAAAVSAGIFLIMGILFSYFHERLWRANQLAADAQFRALFEQAFVGMTQVGLDNRFLRVNQRLCDLLGYSQEELMEKTLPDITHPDDLGTEIALLSKVRASIGSTCMLERLWLRKNQSSVSVNLSVTLVREASGTPKYFILVVEDVTERKRAAVATAELAAIVESSLDAIIGKNLEGVITTWNAGAEKIFGYAADEMIGCSITKLISPDRQDEEEKILARIKRGESVQHFETVRVRKDGGLIDISVTVSPIKDASGEIIGASKVARDITAQKQAAKELKESEERFRTLVETAPEAIYIQTNRCFAYLNAATLRLFGASRPDELLGQPVLERFHPDCRAQVAERIRRLNEERQPVEAVDEVCLTLAGVAKHVNVSAIPFAFQRQSGALVFARDITERKQAEASVRENRAKLEVALASMTDAVFISDAAGQFIEFNEAFATFHRFKNKAECARTLGEYPRILEVFMANGEEAPLEMWAVPRALRGETGTNAEYTLRRKDTGETWAGSYSFSPIRNQGGAIVGSVVVGRDVTERKLAEEKIRRAMAGLERSNKELEHFAYVASHDLQEPLRMVSSYTQLLEQYYGSQLDDKARKYIHYAVDGAIRMQALINDLLTYSRVGRHGKPLESTDSHSVFGEAMRNLSAAIEEAQAIITHGDLPTVSADASQLVLVFQNLIANAIKFRRTEVPQVHVSARKDGGDWRFSVKDNGIGIEAQYAERVFVIFQRLHTREEYPGTGIGLAICQRIVERHGGKIWFESQPGNGTTFFFTIPVLQTKSQNSIQPSL